MKFSKATKTKARLRLALVGPSGGGKTYTALAIATNLGKRVALIDTEHSSASLYAGAFDFDTLNLETFEPQQYIDALDAAAKAGYDVCVIDSLSHAWIGKGGALEQVDNAAKRSQSKNTFSAWREVTPQHNAMVDAIVRSPMHVIVTLRAKTEYVMEKDERTGKTAPRKIGVQPVQRDGLEYEFTVVADVEIENNDLIIGKTRCAALHGKVFRKAGKDFADILNAWLNDGGDPASAPVAPNGAGDLAPSLAASIDATWPKWVAKHEGAMSGAQTMGELQAAFLDACEDIDSLKPPTEYRKRIIDAKDAIKRSLQAAT